MTAPTAAAGGLLPGRAQLTLSDSLRRRVILPASPHYDVARRVYNARVDRYPAAIVPCADADDVAQCVGLARDHGLPLAVRGSGHNAAGHAVIDDGIVIDLAGLKRVAIDTVSATASVGAGLTWGELDGATQAHGLAVPGGTVSSTGVGGLTLGGGIGWLMGPLGLTCDNLLGAEMITAEGTRASADRHANQDLLWGLRGGGGNFGVVTSFTFQLHDVRSVVAGALIVGLERAGETLAQLRDLSPTAPDALTVSPTFVTDRSGERVLSVDLCYAGQSADGLKLAAGLARRLRPARNTVRPRSYLEWQRYLDPMFTERVRGYWKSCFLNRLDDATIEVIVDSFAAVPSPRSTLILEHFHGAMTRVGPAESAYANRHKPFSILITTQWRAQDQDAVNVAWADDLYAAMRGVSDGSGYLNYMGAEHEDIVRRSYGAENYRRLVALKDRHDPLNVFRSNQNIRPTGIPDSAGGLRTDAATRGDSVDPAR